MMWFLPLDFWLAASLDQVLPLYLQRPQEYPRLAKLEETDNENMQIVCSFMTFKNSLYVTLMGHMSWIQMKRPQSLMYHIRKASEMMVQMTTSQG